MSDALVMNASSTGLTNLATQLPTVGTIGSAGILVLIIMVGGSMWLAHEMNRRNSWLQRLIDWVREFAIDKAIVGAITVVLVATLYGVASFFTSGEGQGFLKNTLYALGMVVAGFLGLVVIGVVASPIYIWVLGYCFPDVPPTKKVK